MLRDDGDDYCYRVREDDKHLTVAALCDAIHNYETRCGYLNIIRYESGQIELVTDSSFELYKSEDVEVEEHDDGSFTVFEREEDNE